MHVFYPIQGNKIEGFVLGCVRLGNLDFDFENPDFGFAIEREIRKRISTLIFSFLPFDWEIRKRI